MPEFGFHPDPQDPTRLLMWDGDTWVDLESPFNMAVPATPPQPDSAPRTRASRSVLALLAALTSAALLLAGSVLALLVAVFLSSTQTTPATVTAVEPTAQGCSVEGASAQGPLSWVTQTCPPLNTVQDVRFIPGTGTAVVDAGWWLYAPPLLLLSGIAVALILVTRRGR